ncbi:MAG: hypothetical protein VX700_02160 [Pseudomonadota bacterium]|nr:hypothetical protein [Pseudomonadota bacterium]
MKRVCDWKTATKIVNRNDFSIDWWKTEEIIAGELRCDAMDALGSGPVNTYLSAISLAASDRLQSAASNALAKVGISDVGLSKSAAGSAAVAVNHAALALAAGCTGDHAFAAKYRLFQAGRWPLGVYKEVLYVF